MNQPIDPDRIIALARLIDAAYDNEGIELLAQLHTFSQSDLDTLLVMVVKQAAGALEPVERLLIDRLAAHGANIDSAPDWARFPPLYHALMEDDLELAQLLLDAGGSPDAASWLGTSTLSMLIHDYADRETVSWLIARGADVNGGDATYSPLLAAMGRDLDHLPLLLAAGADPNRRTGPAPGNTHTPMGAALCRGTAALKLMIDAGGDPMDWSDSGLSLLHYAASWCLSEPYDYLAGLGYEDPSFAHDPVLMAATSDTAGLMAALDNRSHVDQPDRHGRTPIGMAVGAKRPLNARALLQRGADANQKVSWTWASDPTALNAYHPDLSWEGETGEGDGRTLLTLAAANGDIATAMALLDGGANIDAPDDHQQTPLLAALDAPHRPEREEVLQLLLLMGANPNQQSPGGSAAIHASTDSPEKMGVLEKLIEFGADIEARDNDGMTPLLCACYHANYEAVVFLLERGADPSARDDDGDSARDLIRTELERLRDEDRAQTAIERTRLKLCLSALEGHCS